MKARSTLLAFVCLGIVASSAQPLQSLLNGTTQAKGLIVPIEVDDRRAATLRIGSVSTEFQKRHFFRIGILPLVVIDSVQIEILRPASALAVLRNIEEQLQASPQQRPCELRQLRIAWPAPAAQSLAAAQARITRQGLWELRDVEWIFPDGSRRRFDQATLGVSTESLTVTTPDGAHLFPQTFSTVLIPSSN